jgi:hypothetical protein
LLGGTGGKGWFGHKRFIANNASAFHLCS